MYPILFIVLLLLMVGMLPTWPYSAAWGLGFFPSGLLGFILLVVILMAVFGSRGAPRI